jgi:hypothetical protein
MDGSFESYSPLSSLSVETSRFLSSTVACGCGGLVWLRILLAFELALQALVEDHMKRVVSVIFLASHFDVLGSLCFAELNRHKLVN